MKAVSLFAGIGGFDLGLARSGIEVELLCEKAAAPAAVLKSRFPGVAFHDDVTTLPSIPRTDLLCAGFPCQDLSAPGKKAGIQGERSGLVSHVFRLIDEAGTPAVLLENVAFMLKLRRGEAIARLVEAFEERGYRWAYRVVDARSFVPQRRERVIMLATREGPDPGDILLADEAQAPEDPPDFTAAAHGFYWTEGRNGLGLVRDAIPTLKSGSTIGLCSAPAVILPDGNVVTPDIRDAERFQGFPVDWTKPAEAVGGEASRWFAIGNAMCVPVAGWVGSRIVNPGALDPSRCRPFQGRWPKAAYGSARGRMQVDISSFPHWVERPPLDRFLEHPGKPLSARATAGFLRRASLSKNLSFRSGFLDLLERHRDAMTLTR